MNETFLISSDENDFCFQPLVCPTTGGFLVAWAEGVDHMTNIWVRQVGNDRTNHRANLIASLDRCNPIFLRPCGHDMYMLTIDMSRKSRVYILDGCGRVLDTIAWTGDEILTCWFDDETLYFATFNDSRQELTIYKTAGIDLNNSQFVTSFNGVYTVPQVMPVNGNFFACWTDSTDNIVFTTGKSNQYTINNQIEIDYLFAARASDTKIMICGFDPRNDCLKLYIISVDSTGHPDVDDTLFWKTDNYHKMNLTCGELNNGFMLLADGPEPIKASFQRFTNAGSWLYLMKEIDDTPSNDLVADLRAIWRQMLDNIYCCK